MTILVTSPAPIAAAPPVGGDFAYRMETFQFTGDGASGRQISFANAQLDPDYVFVRNEDDGSFRTGYFRSKAESPDAPGVPWHTGTEILGLAAASGSGSFCRSP